MTQNDSIAKLLAGRCRSFKRCKALPSSWTRAGLVMAASQSASRYASLRDVEAATERFAGSQDVQPHERLWGPVMEDVASARGALAPASSVLIRPVGDSQLESAAARAMALFPDDVFPSAEDTADTLAARLGGCDFLDDIHFKKGGHGKGGATTAINMSKYRQPRRKTWSVEVDSSQDQPPEPEDQASRALFAYTQFGRKPSDWRSSPMPLEVWEFLVLVWRLAKPYLGAVSRASPPTAVQVMMYYVLLRLTLRATYLDLGTNCYLRGLAAAAAGAVV